MRLLLSMILDKLPEYKLLTDDPEDTGNQEYSRCLMRCDCRKDGNASVYAYSECNGRKRRLS